MTFRSAFETVKFFGGAVLPGASLRLTVPVPVPVALGAIAGAFPSPVRPDPVPVACETTATPCGELTLLVTPIPSVKAAPPPEREAVGPNGFAASTVGDARPLPAPVNVAARLLVLMKEGRKDDRGDVGDVGPVPFPAPAPVPGVGRGVPFGDRPLNGELGIGICVGRLVARDMIGRG